MQIATAMTICGWTSLLIGSGIAVLTLVQRIPFALAPNARLLLAGIALMAGIVFCLVFLGLSYVFRVLLAIERNVRCSANIWRIIEERDATK